MTVKLRRVANSNTLTTSTGLSVDLGTQQAGAIVVDNYSGYWLRLGNSESYIPPYTLGWTENFGGGSVASSLLIVKRPPISIVTNPQTGQDGTVIATVYDDALPPSQGWPISQKPVLTSIATINLAVAGLYPNLGSVLLGGCYLRDMTVSATVEATGLDYLNAKAALQVGLGAWWRFGEAPGAANAVDASGQGNTGTYVGGPMLGVFGLVGDGNTACRFNGATQYVTVPSSAGVQPAAAPFSLSVWIQASPTGAYQVIFSKGDVSVDASYELLLDPNGFPLFQLFTNAAGVQAFDATGTVAANGLPQHIVVTWDGATIRIYTNGVLAVGVTTAYGGAWDPVCPVQLVIGARRTGGATQLPFNGVIDEPEIWPTRLLSAVEILALYTAGNRLNTNPGGAFGVSVPPNTVVGEIQIRLNTVAGPSLPANILTSLWVTSGEISNMPIRLDFVPVFLDPLVNWQLEIIANDYVGQGRYHVSATLHYIE